jgi:hypothetical protein
MLVLLLWLALAGLVAWALARLLAGYPAPPAPTRVLSRGERALVESGADVMFPAGGAVPPSGREAGVATYVDRYVASVPRAQRILIRALFVLVEHATLLWPAPGPAGRRRFSSLDPAQRVAALEGWRTSRLFPRRLVFTSLRAVLCMGYLGDPAVLRSLSLAPPDVTSPVLEPDLLYPPVGHPRSAIRWTEADLDAPSDGTPIPIGGPVHPDYREARERPEEGA